MKPDATQEEVDRFIDSDDSSQVFAQSVSDICKQNQRYLHVLIYLQLMQASRTGQARAVLSEVQTRHDDIKHIEKTILVSLKLLIDV